MLAEFLPVGFADLLGIGEIGFAIGDEPGETHKILGLSSGRFKCRQDIGDGLARLLRKVVRDQSLGNRIPPDLARNINDFALSYGGVGVSARRRPFFGIDQLWQLAH